MRDAGGGRILIIKNAVCTKDSISIRFCDFDIIILNKGIK